MTWSFLICHALVSSIRTLTQCSYLVIALRLFDDGIYGFAVLVKDADAAALFCKQFKHTAAHFAHTAWSVRDANVSQRRRTAACAQNQDMLHVALFCHSVNLLRFVLLPCSAPTFGAPSVP